MKHTSSPVQHSQKSQPVSATDFFSAPPLNTGPSLSLRTRAALADECGKRALMPVLAASALSGLILLMAPAARAQGLDPLGPSFKVNTSSSATLFVRSSQHVACDGAGNGIVAWSNPASYGIYARRFSPTGKALGAEILVAELNEGAPLHCDVAADAEGNFVVVWDDNDGPDGHYDDVYARRYDKNGLPLGPAFRVNESPEGDQSHPAVAMDSEGNFAVSWIHAESESYKTARVRRYSNGGVPEAQFQPGDAASVLAPAYIAAPDISMDDDGDFVVCWGELDTAANTYNVRAHLYSKTGTEQGAIVIPEAGNTIQIAPTVDMDDDGDFILGWTQREFLAMEELAYYDAYARRYSAEGTPLSAAIAMDAPSDAADFCRSVALDNDGDFAVGWQYFDYDEERYRSFVRYFRADGQAMHDMIALPAPEGFASRGSDIALTPQNALFATWEQTQGKGFTENSGIYAQVYQKPFMHRSDIHSGIHGPYAAAVSPDGLHIYVSGAWEHSVAAYTLSASSCTLSFVGKQLNGVAGVHGLRNPLDVLVSPDGKYVYVAGFQSNAIAIFARNSADGELTFLGKAQNGAGFGGMEGPHAMAMSADGQHVYVAAYHSNSLLVFSRDGDKGGALTFVQHLRNGNGGVSGLKRAVDVAVSPDGEHVYALGKEDDAIAVFSRNPASGELSFVHKVKQGVKGVRGMLRPNALALSADGTSVYACGNHQGTLVHFARNTETGKLSFQQVLRQGGASGVDGLAGAYSIALSPDDTHIFAVAERDNAIVRFERAAPEGSMRYVSRSKNGDNGLSDFLGPRHISVSPDGTCIIAIAYRSGTIQIFSVLSQVGGLPGRD